MDRDSLIKDIDSIKFSKNTGRILRILNLLEGEFVNLDTAFSVSGNIKVDEFHRSIVYLQKAGYIEIRNSETKNIVSSEEISNKTCEATLSASGIKLAMGFIKDEAVEM